MPVVKKSNQPNLVPAERIVHYSEWEKFIYEGVISEGVRELIRESWERCARMKVDPFVLGARRILTAAELEARKQRRKNFLEIGTPHVRTLYGLVRDSGFTLFLTDEEGVILLLEGDPKELERQQRINLVEGAVWTESETGTNAVGTAIATAKPIQIVGGEHYCSSQHEITCSAAPIFGPGDEFIGILNMSAASKKVHSHTLGMVVAAAKAIENELRIKRALEALIAANNLMETTLVAVPEGIVTLDKHGNVGHLNPRAAQLLGVAEGEVIGRHINVVFNCMPPLSQIIEKGAVMENVQVAFERGRDTVRYTINARAIASQSTGITGALIVIHGKEVHRLVNEMTGAHAQLTFHNIIGGSKKMAQARDLARSAALTNSTVLLLGESGTGKELFAQSIHNGSRRKGPFIAVNCSAIPRTLIESELFGYEAGSFTGASRTGRPGKFELAHGGTIFLDEIGDMPLDLQAILLRVLQERAVVRVGGHKPIDINVRVIAATNRDLLAKVRDGSFREDLYFRLNVVTVNIPPLRERKEDIPLLVEYLLPQISRRMGKTVQSVTPRVLRHLQEYQWPGNVRELENLLERGAVVAKGAILDTGDIPEARVKIEPFQPGRTEEMLTLSEIEKRALIATLKQTNNLVKAAGILGISRSTLYRKISEYNITIAET